MGYTVLPRSAALSATQIRIAAQESTSELDSLLARVKEIGCDPIEQMYSFAECCHRQKHRWDFRNPSPAVADVLELAVNSATEVVETMMELPPHRRDRGLRGLGCVGSSSPQVLMSGTIVSRPGALDQRFHADASKTHINVADVLRRHRMFNVFVPLVEISEDGDGTQFWPGSHLGRYGRRRYWDAIRNSPTGTLEDNILTMGEMRAPSCDAGGVIIFDYRLLHRGLRAALRQRPIAYAVLTTGKAWDRANFPELTLNGAHDAGGAAINPLSSMVIPVPAEALPLWNNVEMRKSDA
jgi:hypothetical protein